MIIDESGPELRAAAQLRRDALNPANELLFL